MVNDVLSAVTAVAVDVRPAKGSQAAASTLAAQAAATGAAGGGKPMPQSGRAVPVQAEPKPEIKLPELDRAVQNINQFMESSRRSLNFRIDEITGRTIITVLNPETREVVRQIPPEEFLTIARALKESGSLFDALA